MFTLPNKPEQTTTVLTTGLSLYKTSIWTIFPLSLASNIFIFLPFILAPFLEPLQTIDDQAFINLPLLFLTIIAWLIAYLLISAVIFRQHCIEHHIENSLKATLIISINNFIPLVLLGILYSIIIFCGTILLVLPGMFLAFSLMFSFLLRITDKTPILQSLIRSHRLVWGSWWRTTLLVSIPLLLNFALTQIVFLSLLSLLLHQGITELQAYWLALLSYLFLQTFLNPLIFAVSLIVLNDLKLRQKIAA